MAVFRYNITKECDNCGESFLVDVISEQHKSVCDICSDYDKDSSEYERITTRSELEYDLYPTGFRTQAHFLD